MRLPLILTPEAQDEYDDAFAYYDAISPALSADFDARTWDAFGSISSHPRIGTEVLQGLRRVITKQFPYAVFYREVGGEIEVISVFHTARDPDTWRGRI